MLLIISTPTQPTAEAVEDTRQHQQPSLRVEAVEDTTHTLTNLLV
jgi:hypothetical protein